jgi:small-conductance mechanosensitive channel
MNLGTVPFIGVDVLLLVNLVAVVAVTLAANTVLSKLLNKRLDGDKGDLRALDKIKSYLVYSFGVFGIASVLGLSATAAASFLGLLGVGLSFAFKDVLSNFVSGVLMLVSRPFDIGDEIEVQGESGVVEDITLRSTVIRTFDGRKVVMPSSMVYGGIVENKTAYDSRRFSVMVGIGYDDDVAHAKDLIEEAVRSCSSVSDEHEPQVLVSELAGSSVNLEVRAWTSPEKSSVLQSSSEVSQMVKYKLEENGVDIPYPIRTVNVNKQ